MLVCVGRGVERVQVSIGIEIYKSIGIDIDQIQIQGYRYRNRFISIIWWGVDNGRYLGMVIRFVGIVFVFE